MSENFREQTLFPQHVAAPWISTFFHKNLPRKWTPLIFLINREERKDTFSSNFNRIFRLIVNESFFNFLDEFT